MAPSSPAPKTLGVLGLLLLVAPLNAVVTAVALLRKAVIRKPRTIATHPETVLISGGKMTKALQLARSFHGAGHRVVLVETRKYRFTGHRFSSAVDRFHVVPKPEADDYADALLDIVHKERVTRYVPVCSPVASRYDARAKEALAEHCEVFCPDATTVDALDDKMAFSRLAVAAGLPVPDHHRITAPEQVLDFPFEDHEHTYILKSLGYDPVRRLDLTRLPCATASETEAFVRSLPISEEHPWIMQAFIAGQEYCTHSTVRDGVVQLHCCCASSAFQINYAMIDKPEITAWVTRFVGELGLTGQLSFDFIQAADGRIYAIECNPRTHSAITMFYDQPDVARAYLERGVPEVHPTPDSRPTHWLYHEIWRLVTLPGRLQRAKEIARGKDAIFDWADPLPFLIVHHAQIPLLPVDNLRRGKDWMKIDFNIGKLVEPAGD